MLEEGVVTALMHKGVPHLMHQKWFKEFSKPHLRNYVQDWFIKIAGGHVCRTMNGQRIQISVRSSFLTLIWRQSLAIAGKRLSLSVQIWMRTASVDNWTLLCWLMQKWSNTASATQRSVPIHRSLVWCAPWWQISEIMLLMIVPLPRPPLLALVWGSLEIGEAGLLPSFRRTLIAKSVLTSCRSQIQIIQISNSSRIDQRSRRSEVWTLCIVWQA